ISAMCAVRFGSYSIAATRPGTPALVRLKSILRYGGCAPPRRWREVMRRWVLRPPDLRRPSVRLRSGSFFASSGFWAQVAKRRPGEVGLWRFIGIRHLRCTVHDGRWTGGSRTRCPVHRALSVVHSLADLLAFEEL